MAVRSCCECNGSNAKCLHCSCARSKTTCTSCHPSRSGRCHNVLRSTQVPSNILSTQAPSLTITLTATCPPESPYPVSSLSNQQPGDALHSLSLVSLPFFHSPESVFLPFIMYLKVLVTRGQVWSLLN